MAVPASSRPALYRVNQFFLALKATLPAWAGGGPRHLTREQQTNLATILPTPAQQALFQRMSLNDQRHALAVLHTLQQHDHHQPALGQAALLHDVAKSLGQPLIHRVLIVLFEAFWPSALPWLSRLEAGQAVESIAWWRRPFVIHAEHPALGAEWAAGADCLPLAVRLIARHQDKQDKQDNLEENQLLAVLQWADNLN